MSTAVTFNTSDNESLEGELSTCENPRAAIVITHPHPQMGGDMRTPVPDAMFRAVEGLDVAALRFNFRGVGRSTGSHDEGQAEQLDVIAAIEHVVAAAPDVPILLAGWSFGADMNLTVDDERVAGRFLAAAPLRVVDAATMAARTSADPKVFAVPERDQFAPLETVETTIAGWTNSSINLIADADHFFGAQLPALTEYFTAFVDQHLLD